MFPCPRCQHELPDYARFCNYCGFNQTNARIESMRAAQDALNASSPSVPPVPETPPVESMSPSFRVPETPPPATPPSKAHSLTGRYVSEQETRHEPVRSIPVVPHTPKRPLGAAARKPSSPDKSGSPQTLPPPTAPTMRQTPKAKMTTSADRSLDWELGFPDTLALSEDREYLSGDKKNTFPTNRASEQWRTSWRERQHDEAGPAVNVSRGQASVPEPLLAMQHSILRMRAIIIPKNKDKESNFGFWMMLVIMICLFTGLITYIVSTYLTGAQLASQSFVNVNSAEPVLSLQQQDAKSSIFTAGQAIHVQGKYFKAHDQIIFLLDTNVLTETVTTDSNGSFAATLTIPTTQLAGAYAIQAQDNHSGQHAFLNIVVSTSSVNSTSMSLSLEGNPVTSLSFVGTEGGSSPDSKHIAIYNSSASVLQWSVTAVTDDSSGWLLVNSHQTETGGQLYPQEVENVSIGVLTQGLNATDTKHPFKGEIIFTVANQGQIVLPVQLQIAQAGIEVVVSPNPIFAAPSTTAQGACQNASLTLINLNNTIIAWTVKPSDAYNAQHLQVDGHATESSTLQPSGTAGDTKVIQLTCNGVQLGKTYTLTVYYNGQTESVPVYISNQ